MSQSSDKVVFGIDILPSSSPASTREPHYALVILKNGEVYDKNPNVALRRIIRLAWEYRPAIIGVDNIYELGENERSIVKVISLLPPETSVIQVNVDEDKVSKLWEKAKEASLISEYSKFPPLKTAYLVAKLADMGYGLKIRVFEEKTKIIISKGRSFGSGGMSQGRYQRHIRGLILQAVKKIKEALDEHGLDYDMVVRKSESGYDGAVFIVYAPREKLYGIVSTMKGHDIRVIIKPVYRERIEFETVKKKPVKRKPLIVGIDPGIYTGIAILDLDGNVLEVFSGKNIDRHSIIRKIEEYGKPLIIASDVSPPPDTLEKLSTTFNAKLYVPSQSLSQSEKEDLVKTYLQRIKCNISVTDSHQRDALAAALHALRFFKQKFEQIDSYLKKLELDLDVDKIRIDVVKGATIASAIEKEIYRKLSHELKQKHTEEKVRPKRKTKETNVESLLVEVEKLEKEKALLKEKLRKARNEIHELRKQLEIYHKQTNVQIRAIREIQSLSEEVRRLSEELKKVEKENLELRENIRKLEMMLREVSKGTYSIAKTATTLTLASLSKLERDYGKLENYDMVYIVNPAFAQEEAVERLFKENILAVLVEKPSREFKSLLESKAIPVIELNEVKDYVIKIGEIVFFKEELKEEAKARKEALRKLMLEKTSIDLEKIIREYRSERWGISL
ncbi:MAG: DUF460 domain-containing protein [Thermoprotei archaeon]|nr:DUF460 domain-containing protein [Thermoprotei archaeon]